MTTVLSVMAFSKCIYNNFSFTPENINNGIRIISIQNETLSNIDKKNEEIKHSKGCQIKDDDHRDDKLLYSADADADAGPDVALHTGNSDSNSDSDSNSETTATAPTNETKIVCEFEEFATFFIPKPEDSLLWCAYIMINGLENFELVENYYTEGNTFKYKVVGDIRSKKALLKPHKLTLSKIEDSFVNKPFINLEAFYALALTYNLPVSIIQGRKLFEIGRNIDDSNTFVVEKKKGKYGIYLFSNDSHIAVQKLKKSKLDYIRENYWNMENISSPIRPLSAYKLQDLVDICKRLNITTSHYNPGQFGSIGTEKRKTKGELYESICQTI